MANETADIIARWFTEHADGEFERLPPTHPYSVIAPTPATRRVLYTTKPACVVHAFHQCDAVAPIAVIGRYGLPNEDDVAWLRRCAGDHTVAFLGDNDPVDLLVFTWLRSQLDTSYAGINDALIARLGVRLNDTTTIPLAQSEAESIPLLAELCPDFRDFVGSQCAAILDRGRKLEIEALTNSTRAHALALALVKGVSA